MKKYVFLAAVVALCFGVINAEATPIYALFNSPQKNGNRPYTPITPGATTTILPSSSFVIYPANTTDADDGFASVTLPFGFEYNDIVWNTLYINVNGFVMFSPNNPIGLGTNLPSRLFDGSQFPRNVIAPFWGDHFYRRGVSIDPGYLPSSILTKVETIPARSGSGTERRFVIEWRNLNINDKTIASSVGNFQLYLYELSTVPGSAQGDIEFAYGQIGGNGNTVVTQGASIGLKGNSPISDWLNGLVFGSGSRTSTILSNNWQPSGGSDTVILFRSVPTARDGQWGDGDANFSSFQTGIHAGAAQNRFVTANDALAILRSVATNVPLDSNYRRQAYRGDVDHNGRYYFSSRDAANLNTVPVYRREVTTRNHVPRRGWTLAEHFTMGTPLTRDSLANLHTFAMPADNSLDPSAIFFQVQAYDASLIMLYLSGRLVYLPWTIDSIPPFGKATAMERASNMNLGTAINLGNGTYRVPVYLNGDWNHAAALTFNTNMDVRNVEVAPGFEENVLAVAGDKRVALGGMINTDAQTPIAYITVEGNATELALSDIMFNTENRSDMKIAVATGDQTTGVIGSITPNPSSAEVNVSMNIPFNGTYTVAVYNLMGNYVRTLHSGALTSGSVVMQWNGTDNNNVAVAQGAYVIRVEGNGFSASRSVIITR